MLTGFPMIVLGRLAYPSCTCIKIAMSAGLEDFSNPLHHPVVPLCIQIIKGGGGGGQALGYKRKDSICMHFFI